MAAQPDLPLNAAGNDADPQETREWQDALAGVIDKEGAERAHFLIGQMIQQAREEGVDIPYSATTEYAHAAEVPTATSEFMSGAARSSAGTPFSKKRRPGPNSTTAVSANWMYQLFCVPMVCAIQW